MPEATLNARWPVALTTKVLEPGPEATKGEDGSRLFLLFYEHACIYVYPSGTPHRETRGTPIHHPGLTAAR